ncbi:MAG TPA: response regulator [Candidatus Limnocylindrales bacterium]|jgi:CheY-like chemotaxis protein
MGGGSSLSAADGPTTTDATRTIVVLVVDDEPVIRAFVERALVQAGLKAVAAADGREALRLVVEDRVRPTVLVTDIEMPEMTGIELAARLLAMRPALRVVMMTGDPVRAAAARGHPSIVDAVLMKPMQITELVEAVWPAPDRSPVA